IGATSMGRVTMFASEHGMSLYSALREARMVPGLGKAVEKIGRFISQMECFRAMAQSEEYSIQDLIEAILEETGYEEELKAEGEIEAETRIENIQELINKAAAYEEDSQHPSLDEFLEQVALVADIDNVDSSEDRVTLMTLHSAKGLEFPKVYLAGMEDGLFPGMMAVSSDDPTDMEEERRLCYVGITRAKKELVITAARKRMTHGETRYCKPSRFVEEIPAELLKEERLEPVLGSARGADSFGGASGRFGAGEEGLPWNQPGSGTVSTFGKGYNAYASKTAGFGTANAGFKGGKGGLGSGQSFGTNPGFGKSFTVQKAASLDYKEGDRVHHDRFGDGTVKEIVDGARDYEVTVEFDTGGQRKMMACFAKLKKI
ncbi:MAG: ATP-binding domain-containing protein, partial [Enterocloster sp.]|nr:ATP-binding domain-containing protein [Enterocloster sp.]